MICNAGSPDSKASPTKEPAREQTERHFARPVPDFDRLQRKFMQQMEDRKMEKHVMIVIIISLDLLYAYFGASFSDSRLPGEYGSKSLLLENEFIFYGLKAVPLPRKIFLFNKE